MKILFINMSVDTTSGGGTVERTLQLVKKLNKITNVDAKVLTTSAYIEDVYPLPMDQIIVLPCLSNRWYFPLPLLFRIYNAIEWSDVIIMMNHWTVINALSYFVNLIIQRPYLLCPAGSLEIYGRSAPLKRIYSYLVGNRMVDNAAYLVAIPREEKTIFHKQGIPIERIVQIPNGVNESDFSFSETESYKQKYSITTKYHLLFVGRLNEIKGPDLLVEAFSSLEKEFPDWCLILAGPNDGMENELNTIIRKRNLSNRIRIIGYIEGDEKSAAYHAADLLVIPSRSEAMSIVALEAGICRTPVLMTDQCGFSEMAGAFAAVETKVTIEEITYNLRKLMKKPEELITMGHAAYQFVRENYTWEIAAEKHLAICNKSASVKN